MAVRHHFLGRTSPGSSLGRRPQRVLREHVDQDAACKCVEAIGEAAGKLDDLDSELDGTVPDLNLKLARRMRDRISHGYFQIDLEILWSTVTDAIPKTMAAARSLKAKYDE
jgi:uncharacterized protein with HEPN domain